MPEITEAESILIKTRELLLNKIEGLKWFYFDVDLNQVFKRANEEPFLKGASKVHVFF